MSRMTASAALLVILACPIVGSADETKSVIDQARTLWDPEAQMQVACDGIARRYNLDIHQKDAMCTMLVDRVGKFLDKHDKEIWPLLMELAPYQLQGKQPGADVAKRIADRGYSVFDDARAEILRAQDDFAKLLTDEQKQIHDLDVKGLHRQFAQIDDRFQSWKKGEVGNLTPLDNIRLGGNPPLTARHRPQLIKAQISDQWELYVKSFIDTYQLDAGQKVTANSILVDLKAKADQYRRSNSKELKEADAAVADARAIDPPNTAAITAANRLWEVMNQPFDDWFQELKDRLEKIPTEAQREAYFKRNPHMRDKTAKAPPATVPSTAKGEAVTADNETPTEPQPASPPKAQTPESKTAEPQPEPGSDT